MTLQNSPKKLILLGFCAGSIPVICDISEHEFGIKSFDIVKNIDTRENERPYFFDDHHVSVYKDTEYDVENYSKSPVHFAVLNSHIKYILYHHFLHKYGVQKERYLNLIHSSCEISKAVSVSNGNLIEPLSALSPFSKLGFGVTIKRKCSLGHHSVLGDFVNLNPGVDISGNVTVGEGTEVGTGTSVVNNVSIGKHCLIGAGSVVTRDIPDGVIAYGNPCKVIRINERWVKVMQLTGGKTDISTYGGAIPE